MEPADAVQDAGTRRQTPDVAVRVRPLTRVVRVKAQIRPRERGNVKRFRPGRKDDLGVVLRASRSEPSRDFVDTLSERIASEGRRTRLRSASRLSFAAALTVFMLGTLASFGGLGYAASSTKGAFKKVARSNARQRAAPRRATSTSRRSRSVTTAIRSASASRRWRRIYVMATRSGRVACSGRAHRAHWAAERSASASGGALPFTGISLAATVLLSLVLMTLGFALRRRANAKQ